MPANMPRFFLRSARSRLTDLRVRPFVRPDPTDGRVTLLTLPPGLASRAITMSASDGAWLLNHVEAAVGNRHVADPSEIAWSKRRFRRARVERSGTPPRPSARVEDEVSRDREDARPVAAVHLSLIRG